MRTSLSVGGWYGGCSVVGGEGVCGGGEDQAEWAGEAFGVPLEAMSIEALELEACRGAGRISGGVTLTENKLWFGSWRSSANTVGSIPGPGAWFFAANCGSHQFFSANSSLPSMSTSFGGVM